MAVSGTLRPESRLSRRLLQCPVCSNSGHFDYTGVGGRFLLIPAVRKVGLDANSIEANPAASTTLRAYSRDALIRFGGQICSWERPLGCAIFRIKAVKRYGLLPPNLRHLVYAMGTRK